MAASFHLFFIIFLSGFAAFPIFSFVYANANTTQHSWTPINHHLYHSGEGLIEKIKSLVHRHPDKLTVETIQAGTKDYKADITVVTYSQNWEQSGDKSKLRILLSFGQHARELISSELALRILSALGEEQFPPEMDAASLHDTLENVVIKIVPMENLNGRKIVDAGELCERRNGRGVDLNRNWAVNWGKKEKDYDPAEEYPGTAPFSEPETQIMREIAVSFNPHIWVSVHSGTNGLFMPYDHKKSTPDGLPSQRMRELLDELNVLYCSNRCLVGSGGTAVGYLAHGTATDYMYDVVRVPMAFTFEIYGDDKASGADCFKMFNPIDQTTFKRVMDQCHRLRRWLETRVEIRPIENLGSNKSQGHKLLNKLWVLRQMGHILILPTMVGVAEIVDFCDFLSPTPEEQAARDAAVHSIFDVIKYI